MDQKAREIIFHIKSAMERAPLNAEILLYRGISEDYAEEILRHENVPDPAFESTTFDITVAARYGDSEDSKYINILEMIGEKGEGFIHVMNDGEGEILLRGGVKYVATRTRVIQSLTLKNKDRSVILPKPARIIGVMRQHP